MHSMIIDFHTHIYPAKIAAKAAEAIGKFYEDAPMAWHGTSEELIAEEKKAGIDISVVHSAATSAAQVEVINNFIIDECNKHPEFIGFGTMHPDYENFSAELERIRTAGLKGIKLHSDFQKFTVDDPRMDKIYEKLVELNMAVIFHAGDYRFDYSGPKRIAHLIEKFPELKIVAAHFGGYTEWDNAVEYLVGKRVWMDTSSTFWKLPMDKALEMIRKHGAKYFFFGTDFPMWDATEELARFNQLKLTPEEKEAILYTNAKNFLDDLC